MVGVGKSANKGGRPGMRKLSFVCLLIQSMWYCVEVKTPGNCGLPQRTVVQLEMPTTQ